MCSKILKIYNTRYKIIFENLYLIKNFLCLDIQNAEKLLYMYYYLMNYYKNDSGIAHRDRPESVRSGERTVPIAAGWLILITNSSPAIAPRGIRA